jgi:hypothetical protein
VSKVLVCLLVLVLLVSACVQATAGRSESPLPAPARPEPTAASVRPAAPAAPPVVVPQAGPNCHPAYPTVCIPAPPPDLDCKDIPYRNFPVDRRFGDPHRFDGDRDGIGCEGR